MSDNYEDTEVLALLRQTAQSRVKLARAMLAAYAADAFDHPATPEDITRWTEELADAEKELRRLSN
ncbi:hypothetical protein [Rhizobium sp. YS-1r]|uniref:CopG family transcriptional regulator n=1 Tax=Neorhizobium phenanthreniclasticum TaxID=3157917 RepID=A0ABV0LZU2_9HYPH|nr:hypothetical protein [Rhizobium sp. YS-1r]KGE01136.1 hypothetical protein JL39_08335 [Rhizobium sp. YS-1r]